MFFSFFFFFYSLVNEARRTTSKILLRDYYFKTDIVQGQGNYDNFVRGLLTQPTQEQDQFFTEEVPIHVYYGYYWNLKPLDNVNQEREG